MGRTSQAGPACVSDQEGRRPYHRAWRGDQKGATTPAIASFETTDLRRCFSSSSTSTLRLFRPASALARNTSRQLEIVAGDHAVTPAEGLQILSPKQFQNHRDLGLRRPPPLADQRLDSGAFPVALRAPCEAPESVFFPCDIYTLPFPNYCPRKSWGGGRKLRHPVFLGLHDDKRPRKRRDRTVSSKRKLLKRQGRSKGDWTAPCMIRIEGGGVGFLAGVGETDLVLLAMNDEAVTQLMRLGAKIGFDVMAAAGPVGRSSEPDNTPVARGVFAGISVGGTTLRTDDDANALLCGIKINDSEILSGKVDPTPGYGLWAASSSANAAGAGR